MKIITHVATKATRGRRLTIVYGVHKTPFGKMLLAVTAEGICWLGLTDKPEKLFEQWRGASFIHDQKVTEKAAKEVAKLYPKKFAGLKTPVVLYGTAFQLKVWKQLLKIDCGAVVTYQDVARKIGKAKAVRAVGSAVGDNTVPVLVPCHRVVNKNPNRINYGWGAKAKLALLSDEGVRG
jgi:AraC family transcriptional regulator of adaptative response/methylated-DNA-[protein]-cysteine methyltransferase